MAKKKAKRDIKSPVKCEDCNQDFEMTNRSIEINLKNKTQILCSSCRRKGRNNPNFGKRKAIRKRDNINLICDDCKKDFTIYFGASQKRFDKYKKNLCTSCSKKGEYNPFYGMKFSKEKIKEFSSIRKDYYNDPELGEARRAEQSEKYSGKNNPMYKGADLASDYTYRCKSYRAKVLLRDNYICQKCKNRLELKKLEVRHKNSANWDIEGRKDIDNGATLCLDCHKDFHMKYGYGDNNACQFEKFLKEGSETRSGEYAKA